MAKKKGLSKVLSTSGVISTAGKPCRILSIGLCAGTTAGSLEILDGGSGGTSRWKINCKAQTAVGDQYQSHRFGPEGLICTTDAYGVMAGTGAIGYVEYEELA